MDPSKNNGRNGPVTEQHFSYRKVFEEIIARMQVLPDLGVTRAIGLPLTTNIPEQIFYMLAARGWVWSMRFSAVSRQKLCQTAFTMPGQSLSSPLTAISKRRSGRLRGTYADPALDNYIPGTALATLKAVLATYDLGDLRTC